MTYLWQEEKGKPFYRFQTDELSISNKMKRRKRFNLVGDGFNCQLWIYRSTFSRPILAKNTLKALTGERVNFDKKEDIFYS